VLSELRREVVVGFVLSELRREVVVGFVFSELRREVVIGFVDIGGIVDHHCFNSFFKRTINRHD
jgi:hypothetical protein